MENEFLMGNEAIGLGAMHAGVNLVCGYPGTPSTEILESVATVSYTHLLIILFLCIKIILYILLFTFIFLL